MKIAIKKARTLGSILRKTGYLYTITQIPLGENKGVHLLTLATSTTEGPAQFQAMEMIALGLLVLAAHLGGKLCRRLRLSDVTGQLLGGAMVGPFVLQKLGVLGDGSLYGVSLEKFYFFIFVFLGMVAFGIGEELHISRLRKVGLTALIITLIQGVVTWALIASAFYFIGNRDLLQSLLIGSIGIASAPAVTFVLMNQLRVEGRLRHMLGSVVVLADLIEVIIFSILLQISLKHLPNAEGGSVLGEVSKELGLAVLLGGGIYCVLRVLVRRKAASHDEEEITERESAPDVAFLHRILAEHPSPSAEILLVVMGTVSLGTGLAYYFNLPFLITAILAGFMVANFHSHAIFDSLKIDNISAVLNLGFFALIGAKMKIDFQSDTLWLSGLYIVTRLSGKLIGTWLGCKVVSEERKISACLPTLLLPQAGVGAVEAVFAATVLGKPEIAIIILPAIVFFEIVGVYMVDRTLRRWRSWVADEEKVLKQKRSKTGEAEAAGRLLAYLTPKFICIPCPGGNKHEVIEGLVDHARAATEQHIDRAQALQVLSEREKLSPTGFGNGIAIPHCRLMGLDKPILVFAKHDAGVVFGGVDNEPCHLILLILSSARDPAEHLRLLASSAHVLGDDEVRAALRESTTPEEFHNIIQTIAHSE